MAETLCSQGQYLQGSHFSRGPTPPAMCWYCAPNLVWFGFFWHKSWWMIPHSIHSKEMRSSVPTLWMSASYLAALATFFACHDASRARNSSRQVPSRSIQCHWAPWCSSWRKVSCLKCSNFTPWFLWRWIDHFSSAIPLRWLSEGWKPLQPLKRAGTRIGTAFISSPSII